MVRKKKTAKGRMTTREGFSTYIFFFKLRRIKLPTKKWCKLQFLLLNRRFTQRRSSFRLVFKNGGAGSQAVQDSVLALELLLRARAAEEVVLWKPTPAPPPRPGCCNLGLERRRRKKGKLFLTFKGSVYHRNCFSFNSSSN